MRALFWQAVRYGLVGASATAVDWLAYWGLTRSVPLLREWYLAANLCAFSISVVWGYLMHRRFTFRAGGAHRHQFPKFLAVTAIGLGINSAVLYGGVTLGAHDLLAKLAATALTAIWNFSGQKLWTFRLSAPPGGPYTGPVDMR